VKTGPLSQCRQRTPVDELTLVSIIIPTLNAGRTLARTLVSISNQTHSEVEVIVVDQGSNDATLSDASKAGATIVRLKRRHTHYSPPSHARNIGAKIARGDFLFHLDADMQMERSLLEKCVDACFKGRIDAITIPEIDIGDGFWSKCKKFERSLYFGDPSIEAPRFISTRAFQVVGGYDETISSGEDWDLRIRLERMGFHIARLEGSFVIHDLGRLALSSAVLKKYNYGKTFSMYVRKHRTASISQALPLRSAYRRNFRLGNKDPTTIVGTAFMRTCEYLAILFGMLVGANFEAL